MRNLGHTASLLRSGRALNRALSSVEETKLSPICQRLTTYGQPSCPALPRSTPTCASQRTFSQTVPAAKKKHQQEAKAPKNNSRSSSSPSTSSSSDAPKRNPDEPFDLADLEHAFTRTAEHHLAELTKARAGGRFNPDVLGALRVRPDKKSPETFPLHELAAIVPRRGSRRVSVLVHEAANVKPVMAALQASPDLNQQPQRTEDNELELVLTVGAEDPEETAKRLRDILNAWRQGVRDAKHRREQAVKKWLKDKTIVRDDYEKLEKEMQKLQDKKMAEIKAKEKEVEGKS